MQRPVPQHPWPGPRWGEGEFVLIPLVPPPKLPVQPGSNPSLCASPVITCLHAVSLGPCFVSASPLRDQVTRNPLLQAGPPAEAGQGVGGGLGMGPHLPPGPLRSLVRIRRGTESSGTRGYVGHTTNPLKGWLGEKKKNHPRGYFCLGNSSD